MTPMSGEARSIAASAAPVTRASLAADLGRLGVRPGSVLLVHSSLSALGWVCGGAQALVEALLDALGPDGTLVVPTHTSGNSEPSRVAGAAGAGGVVAGDPRGDAGVRPRGHAGSRARRRGGGRAHLAGRAPQRLTRRSRSPRSGRTRTR